jgi:hypothetical protein
MIGKPGDNQQDNKDTEGTRPQSSNGGDNKAKDSADENKIDRGSMEIIQERMVTLPKANAVMEVRNMSEAREETYQSRTAIAYKSRLLAEQAE